MTRQALAATKQGNKKSKKRKAVKPVAGGLNAKEELSYDKLLKQLPPQRKRFVEEYLVDVNPPRREPLRRPRPPHRASGPSRGVADPCGGNDCAARARTEDAAHRSGSSKADRAGLRGSHSSPARRSRCS